MQVDTFGGGAPLVWVMGWGNVAESRHERWFVDRLVAAGYEVHAVEIPTNDPDFEGAYVDPVREYVAGLDDPALLGHSTGCLVLAHVQPEQPVVHLGPWWRPAEFPLLLGLLLKLPISRPFVPSPIEAAALGDLATDDDATAPDAFSPAWAAAMDRAQHSLPPLDPDDVVFYSPDDEVVSVDAIESHTSPDQRRTYDGGHELFSSTGRDEYAAAVVDELDSR